MQDTKTLIVIINHTTIYSIPILILDKILEFILRAYFLFISLLTFNQYVIELLLQ